MESERIDRINELAKLAKERELTSEEIQEREELRKGYLENFRANMKATLDNTVVEYPDGTKMPLKDAPHE